MVLNWDRIYMGFMTAVMAGVIAVLSLRPGGCSSVPPVPVPTPAPKPAVSVTLDPVYNTEVGKSIILKAKTSMAVTTALIWSCALAPDTPSLTPSGLDGVDFVARTQGNYRVHVCGVVDGKVGRAETWVIVGPAGPSPPIPIPEPPPGPVEPPVPPTPPTPPQPPSPIPGTGLRVLLVYDVADESRTQNLIRNDGSIRAYLQSHCAKGADNKTPEYRFWDKGEDVTNENTAWQAAFKLPRTSLPWLYVGNGSNGYSGPLPATVDDTLKLLKQFGGQ